MSNKNNKTLKILEDIDKIYYDNKINALVFKDFTKNDYNLFFTICGYINKTQQTYVDIPLNELKKKIKYTGTSKVKFQNDLKEMNRKLLQANAEVEIDDVIYQFVFFSMFAINNQTNSLGVKLNEPFAPLLIGLTKNFTGIEIDQFISLKSTYSKDLFRLIKQWKYVGKLTINIEEFRDVLYIPENYRMTQINSRIIEPSIKELEQFIPGIKVKKNKKGRGQGGKVVSFTFTFTPEKRSIIKK